MGQSILKVREIAQECEECDAFFHGYIDAHEIWQIGKGGSNVGEGVSVRSLLTFCRKSGF